MEAGEFDHIDPSKFDADLRDHDDRTVTRREYVEQRLSLHVERHNVARLGLESNLRLPAAAEHLVLAAGVSYVVGTTNGRHVTGLRADAPTLVGKARGHPAKPDSQRALSGITLLTHRNAISRNVAATSTVLLRLTTPLCGALSPPFCFSNSNPRHSGSLCAEDPPLSLAGFLPFP